MYTPFSHSVQRKCDVVKRGFGVKFGGLAGGTLASEYARGDAVIFRDWCDFLLLW